LLGVPIQSVCGPYEDGYIRLYLADNTVVLAHRYIMAHVLNRELESGEEVHHKDKNRSNNSIDNLELLSSAEHKRLHTLGTGVPVELVCDNCGIVFFREQRQVRTKQKQGQSVFYCNRSCMGVAYWKRKRAYQANMVEATA
jgi:intracellular sulfur oxidation DsrE/DsrF family protein